VDLERQKARRRLAHEIERAGLFVSEIMVKKHHHSAA
jgi:hypothetical protein